MSVKKIPMRQCTGCREMKNKRDMIRVIRSSDGAISIDATGRKNGRGAYICRNMECFRQAVKNRGLERSLKTEMQAGKVKSGEFAAEKSVKTGRAALVIVAGDASDNTKKKFRDMCAFYKVPFMEYGTRETLGHSIGKEFRASLAIEDVGFYKAIRKQMELSRM